MPLEHHPGWAHAILRDFIVLPVGTDDGAQGDGRDKSRSRHTHRQRGQDSVGQPLVDRLQTQGIDAAVGLRLLVELAQKRRENCHGQLRLRGSATVGSWRHAVRSSARHRIMSIGFVIRAPRPGNRSCFRTACACAGLARSRLVIIDHLRPQLASPPLHDRNLRGRHYPGQDVSDRTVTQREPSCGSRPSGLRRARPPRPETGRWAKRLARKGQRRKLRTLGYRY